VRHPIRHLLRTNIPEGISYWKKKVLAPKNRKIIDLSHYLGLVLRGCDEDIYSLVFAPVGRNTSSQDSVFYQPMPTIIRSLIFMKELIPKI
jgi:hypothetical protein